MAPATAASNGRAPAASARPATGAAEGRVFFGAATPPPQRFTVDKDHGVCGAQIASEEFVISDSKGLGNVVVRIEGASAPRQVQTTKNVEVEQRGCVYRPHVQAVLAPAEGLTLAITNGDEILHNVHSWNGEETLFNIAQPFQGQEFKVPLEIQSGVVTLLCDVHSWMSAYVVLVDHPYFTITDSEGRFRIDSVPPGNYTISAWHEILGTMEKEVRITESGIASVDFEILPAR